VYVGDSTTIDGYVSLFETPRQVAYVVYHTGVENQWFFKLEICFFFVFLWFLWFFGFLGLSVESQKNLKTRL